MELQLASLIPLRQVQLLQPACRTASTEAGLKVLLWRGKTRSVGNEQEETGESRERSEWEGAAEEKGGKRGRRESTRGDKIPVRPFKLHLGHGGRVTGGAQHDARFTARWVVGGGAEEEAEEGNKVKLNSTK